MLNFLFVFMAPVLVFQAMAADKTSCKPRELRNRDCRLSLGQHHVRLLTDTIARDDGAAHVVDPMPLKGDWEKVVFEISQNHPVLQLWIWDPGKGEAQVQSLHWFVGDARPGPVKFVADDVVRRRRLKPGEDEKKKVYLYDGWEKHSLKVLKDGKYEWNLGTHKKIIDPNAVVAPQENKGAPAAHEKGH